MFNNIAPTYDVLNHRLSWNIDRYWRNRAIKELATAKPQQRLDVATGTGDFAILQAERLHPEHITATDISEGMDLDAAVRRYEAIVAPANYKRPKAIFTKKMLEEAQKKFEKEGYLLLSSVKKILRYQWN